MATATVQLNNAGWVLVCSGACRVDRQFVTVGASASEKAIIEATDPLIFVHIGTVAPVGVINAVHPMKQSLNYTGTEDVYMRCSQGEAIVVVTPIL